MFKCPPSEVAYMLESKLSKKTVGLRHILDWYGHTAMLVAVITTHLDRAVDQL